MKFLILLASLAFVSNALPTSETTDLLPVEDFCAFGDLTCTPPEPIWTIPVAQEPEVLDELTTRDIAKRQAMYQGRRYQIANWVIQVGSIAVGYYSDSTWVFNGVDRRNPSFTYIAEVFAYSVTHTMGESTTSPRKEMGGGWSWYGSSYGGYDFSMIPYDLAYQMMMDAEETAGQVC
jgi:hypothetical protein